MILVIILGYFQLILAEFSLKIINLPKIVSSEDHTKLCFKNEWTLLRFLFFHYYSVSRPFHILDDFLFLHFFQTFRWPNAKSTDFEVLFKNQT